MEETIKGSSPLRKPFTKDSPQLSSTSSSSSSNNKNKKKPLEQEDRLGLLQNRNDPMSQSFNSDFSIKIEPNSSSMAEKLNPILRGSSYDFQNDVNIDTQKKKSNDNTECSSEEFDFPKGEVDLENHCLSPVSESPNDYGKITPKYNQFPKVSFEESKLVHRRASDEVHQQNAGVGVSGRDDQVVHCSSNASFQQRKSGLMRMKTKSRFQDPPEEDNRRSGRVNRSGLMGKSEEIEGDDSFEEDSEEFKKGKLNFFTILLH